MGHAWTMDTGMKAALRNFIEQCARRDGSRAVPEGEVRGAIRGYIKCWSIANRNRRELTTEQLDRAVRYYHRRRVELNRQPPLLAA